MATEAQILANRENAKKSTGPRTAKGKAAVRFNALKHGGRSRKTTMPVLPEEAPRELERHVLAYVESWKPECDAERDLLARAARLAWMLDRADRAESAHLARVVRQGQSTAEARAPQATARVAKLGRDLYQWAEPDAKPTDAPSVLVAGLEELPEGRAWLLEQWAGFRNLVAGGIAFTAFDRYRFLRLLGNDPLDALTSLRANAIFRAWNALGPEAGGEAFFALARERAGVDDPILLESLTWRALGPPPPTARAARGYLLTIVDGQVERLRDLQAQDERTNAPDGCGAFDAGPQLAAHRRVSNARGREMLRILESLRKLRKVGHHSDGMGQVDASETRPNAPSMPAEETPFPISSKELATTDPHQDHDNQSRFAEELGVGPDVLDHVQGGVSSPALAESPMKGEPGTEISKNARSEPSPFEPFLSPIQRLTTPEGAGGRDDQSRSRKRPAKRKGRKIRRSFRMDGLINEHGPDVKFAAVLPGAGAPKPGESGLDNGEAGRDACRDRQPRDNGAGRHRTT